jgi:Cu+-exporting ATPase
MSETKIQCKDPICGMNVDETSAFHAERDGKTSYFCSDTCRQKFLSVSGGGNPKGKNCCG